MPSHRLDGLRRDEACRQVGEALKRAFPVKGNGSLEDLLTELDGREVNPRNKSPSPRR